MVNIFNLFLFLLITWVALMFLSGNLVMGFFIFGIICSALIAYFSFKLNLIRQDSELLYLSLGFYRHFAKLYLKNFFPALNLIVDIAVNKTVIRPFIFKIDIPDDENINYTLLNSAIDISAGLFCIESEQNNFLIHALDQKYFDKFDLFRIQKALSQVNDDNLV